MLLVEESNFSSQWHHNREEPLVAYNPLSGSALAAIQGAPSKKIIIDTDIGDGKPAFVATPMTCSMVADEFPGQRFGDACVTRSVQSAPLPLRAFLRAPQ
jgi:hypothetical protein